MNSSPPNGTVTFLFTDIEGSTKLAQQYPEAMPGLLARHNEILNQAIKAYDGFVFRVIGDSFSASFHNANDALRAVMQAQQSLHDEAWSPAPIKVRMGIHTGAAQLEIDSEENKYSGYATLALTQRIMSAGHGGQILLSQSTYELTRDRLPEEVQLVDMGERRLKDILRAERIYQLSIPGLPSEFPPIKTLDSFPNNLPLQLTSFVGREKEIAEIHTLLQELAPSHADRFRRYGQDAPFDRGRHRRTSLLPKRCVADRTCSAGRPGADHPSHGASLWIAGTSLCAAGIHGHGLSAR